MRLRLYFIELENFANFLYFRHYLKLLPYHKQVRINSCKFDIDKKLSLISDLFVRLLACKMLKLNNANLSFDNNAYGKPFLVGFPEFQYNISHTRSAIAIGIAEKPIGIDIEKSEIMDVKIAERFFSENENQYILSPSKDRDKLFSEVWTKKEAYLKWTGKGLSLPLSSFDITDIMIKNMLNTFEINDYTISVCSEQSFNEIDIIKLSEKQIDSVFNEFADSACHNSFIDDSR